MNVVKHDVSQRTLSEIRLNGESRSTPALTVSDLLEELHLLGRPVAVEINRVIVAREDFSTAPVRSGDSVEIIQFVGGG